jgi:nucleoid-associated protein YgaU
MRTIGNIERFLVGGIVLVIGVILVVAIRGANDVRSEYDKRVADAKSAGKNGPAIKRDTTLPRPPPQPADRGANGPAPITPNPSGPNANGAGGAGARPVQPNVEGGTLAGGGAPLDPAVKKAMDERNAALNGKVDGKDGKAGDHVAPGPNVLEDPNKTAKQPVDLTNGGKKPEPSELPDAPRPVVEPPAPAPTPAAAKEYWYEVQKGDTLERIARALYNDGALWKEIHEANPSLPDAHSIKVGHKIKLPKEPSVASAFVTTKDAGATSESHTLATPPDHASNGGALKSEPAKNEKSASSGFKRTTAIEQYKVQKGDTLMSIALANYGTKGAWKLILDANVDAIADKDRLKVGTTLKLPAE